MLDKLEKKIERAAGARDQLKKQKKERTQFLRSLKARDKRLRKAQSLLQTAASMTQDQIKMRLCSVVNLALCEVFQNKCRFDIEFTEKKGTTYAELFFTDGENRTSPLDDNGGGMVDLVSLSLRLTLWSLHHPKLRKVLIMDEPLKFLSRDLIPDAVGLLRELSDTLNIQIIMVTHDEQLVEAGDKIFRVTQEKGISKVEVESC